MSWTIQWPGLETTDRSETPPSAGRLDIVFAVAMAVFVLADIPEGVVVWQPAGTVAALIAVAATYRKRHNPSAALAAASVSLFVTELGSGLVGSENQPSSGHIIVVGILVYAFGRWAPWRAIPAGLAVIAVLSAAGEVITAVPDWDAKLNEALIWGVFAATGIAVRYRAALRHTTAERIRSEERERIARDLHDVVAHHVSAIAMQAEGARAAAKKNPDVAIDTLGNIHTIASTTLTEMRHMVTSLRDDTDRAVLTPRNSVRELEDLLSDSASEPRATLTLVGPVDSLPGPVAAALLRIAQEAVTNARRHGKDLTTIDVEIASHGPIVELTVSDDGGPAAAIDETGYGIIGMTERSAMLGGTLVAGPLPERGWMVHVTIPIESTPS